ncbi:hypothetical protein BDV95DRAFT_502689 [Massariosphaeria phaeospora]|uniref:Uncharacterized protein n=1 Tax=Massariosphaeria phaeospora TaxID=100035 RepID=A0A7C8M378_9PLEO|nr:hypothetical protein BDV95DRAFT_502689 [Massariosphaeria phaeospora]
MSDYGDDYSDYGDEWMYIEEEYFAADDLAEHAVGSPPPTTYEDDALFDWDRFDYFNDLEYASDGYDDAEFRPHDTKAAQTGQKRKRSTAVGRSKKKQKAVSGEAVPVSDMPMSKWKPVVWRSQADRNPKPKLLDEGDTESYALLKDWRVRMADTPAWASKSRGPQSPTPRASRNGKEKAASVDELVVPSAEPELDEEDDGEADAEIDPAVLMQALQSRLAAAGGPLNGMDPQQLLQFAMRMMTEKDAGDDIAGEMADQMLDQEEDDEEGEGDEANLVSWIAQQRNTTQETATDATPAPEAPHSPDVAHNVTRPPTPPSSEANRSVRPALGTSSRKRKAKEAAPDGGSSANAPKRRATRSFDAPTAASAKTTRSGRAHRS